MVTTRSIGAGGWVYYMANHKVALREAKTT